MYMQRPTECSTGWLAMPQETKKYKSLELLKKARMTKRLSLRTGTAKKRTRRNELPKLSSVQAKAKKLSRNCKTLTWLRLTRCTKSTRCFARQPRCSTRWVIGRDFVARLISVQTWRCSLTPDQQTLPSCTSMRTNARRVIRQAKFKTTAKALTQKYATAESKLQVWTQHTISFRYLLRFKMKRTWTTYWKTSWSSSRTKWRDKKWLH